MRAEMKSVIENQERRIREKKQAIEDMQNELELLYIQAYQDLKDCVNYYPLDCRSNAMALVNAYDFYKYGPPNIVDLPDEFRCALDQYDKFKQQIHDLFGTDEVTAVCPIPNSYVAVCFDAFGHSWRLDIPTTESIDLPDFVRKGYEVFMLTLYFDAPSGSFELVGRTFDVGDLPNRMQSYIENRDKDQ